MVRNDGGRLKPLSAPALGTAICRATRTIRYGARILARPRSDTGRLQLEQFASGSTPIFPAAFAAMEKTWRNNFDPSQAIVGSRGPQVTGFSMKHGGREYTMASARNTLLIHGGPSTWEGYIAYNDNHVNFETTMAPAGATYKNEAGAERADCLFLDEADDPSGINNFLGIFTTAGATKVEYGAIWD